jgi:hypothetical protein
MKRATITAAICLLGLYGSTRAGGTSPPAKTGAVTIAAADVKFGPPPPVLPAGAQLAVLHGDPTRNGPFAMRLKLPDGYRIAPHWHSKDEELTIISGTFMMAMGDKADQDVHAMTAGAYHFLPARMHHSAAARGETVVEVHGTGPFDLHYLNPADDPSRKAAGTP